MLMRRFCTVILTAGLAAMLTGCGSEPSGGGGGATLEYKDMKQMVIDILKTEDAQKALQETSQLGAGGGMMAMSATQQEQVRLAVKEVLVSPGYEKVLDKLMTDPKFAGEFAKAVNEQNKQIHKDLLKDPTYQKDLVSVMKGSEMEKVILDAMDSDTYRTRVKSIMQETMQSPIVRLELLELLQKAVREELKPKEQSGGESGGGGESSGGGGESGGSESSGGGGS